MKKEVIVFQETEVRLCDADDSKEAAFIPNGSWVLSDSRLDNERPGSAFLSAVEAGRGWVVHTTTSSIKSEALQRKYRVRAYWLDIFTLDELVALGYAQYGSCWFC